MKTNQSDIYFITYRKGDDNLLEGFKGKLQRKGLEALMMLKGEEAILQTMNGYKGHLFIELEWRVKKRFCSVFVRYDIRLLTLF